MVVHGLNQVGSVAVEAEQVNGKNPDIEYAGLGISFVADVTTVSDAGLDKKNPYEDLSNLVESLKTKLGMPIGGVDIRIRGANKRCFLANLETALPKIQFCMPIAVAVLKINLQLLQSLVGMPRCVIELTEMIPSLSPWKPR